MKKRPTTPRIDTDIIFERIGGNSDRTRISLYLSKGLYQTFKKACGEGMASRVMEELMKSFIESKKKGRE